jgi:acyl-CoA thioesterase I
MNAKTGLLDTMKLRLSIYLMFLWCWSMIGILPAQDAQRWEYSPASLQPFWSSDVVVAEPVLFIRDPDSGESRGSLLFPIAEVLEVHDSTGGVTYQAGADYQFNVGSREIIVPAGSRIVSKLPAELRRPAGSQQHRLTHRDGNGEILFGATLEYHQMQTLVTYRKSDSQWPVTMPTFDAGRLPKTIAKLREHQEISIVLLGDSISTGCNASGWGGGPPYQPAYQDLLVQHLQAHYETKVKLTNLSVGGTATPWGITKIEEVIQAQPDLVVIAFGMNDCAGRPANDYGQNVATMIENTRAKVPGAEFILVASMLGNRDWILLQHDLLPKYRDELASLCQPGIALADMNSVWEEFFKRKQDADLTGNGVNHPNDFGHRVYAQVLATLLVSP